MVTLGFNIGDFDLSSRPRVTIPDSRVLEISSIGTQHILDTLVGMNVKATFFCSAFMAEHRPSVIRRIADEGHEIACYFNKGEKGAETLAAARALLEDISGKVVIGHRTSDMEDVDFDSLTAAGFLYDSSLNPTWISAGGGGSKPRSIHKEGMITEIPISVTPALRIPLYWLSMQHMPPDLYNWLCHYTFKEESWLNLGYYAWEFDGDIHTHGFGISSYIKHNAGYAMFRRLNILITSLREKGAAFGTISQLLHSGGFSR